MKIEKDGDYFELFVSGGLIYIGLNDDEIQLSAHEAAQLAQQLTAAIAEGRENEMRLANAGLARPAMLEEGEDD